MTSSSCHNDFSLSFMVLNMSITFSKPLLTAVLLPRLLTIIFPQKSLFDSLLRGSKCKSVRMKPFSFNRFFCCHEGYLFYEIALFCYLEILQIRSPMNNCIEQSFY